MMAYKKSAFKKGAFLLLMIVCAFLTGSCSSEKEKETQVYDEVKEETYVNPAMFNSDMVCIGLPELNRIPTPYDAMGITENSIVSLLYEGLFKINEMGGIESNLAKTYKLDMSKKEMIIELKPNVLFHDGTPLKAEHVYNVYYFLKGVYAERDFFSRLREVVVLDDLRLLFKFSDFAYEDFNALTIPIYHFGSDNYTSEESGAFEYRPSVMPHGTGPFLLNTQEKNVWIFLENPLYRQEASVVKTIKLMTTSDTERLEGLKNGTLDLAYLNPKLDSEKQLKETPYLSPFEVTSDYLVTLGMNLKHPLFKEKKFRQAMQYGINRKVWSNEVWPIGSETAYAPVPTKNPFYPKEQALNDYKYDPVKANALLDELGLLINEETKTREFNENPIVLYLDVFSEVTWAHKLAIRIKEDLGFLGMEIIIRKTDFDALSKKVFEEKESDFFVMGWELPVLSNQGAIFGSQGKFNAGKYYTESSDRLFEKLDETFDGGVRQSLMTQWIVQANEDLPWIFMAYRGELWGVNERLKGFKVEMYSDWTNFVNEWELIKP